MRRLLSFAVLFILLITSCSLFEKDEDPKIRNLKFSRGDFHSKPYQAYQAGAPVVVTAGTLPSNFTSPAEIFIISSAGESANIHLNTLHKIPARQLAGAIEDHDGSVIITVKEADRERAYDREQNRYTTSAQTLQRVRNWIDGMEGVEVVQQIINSPVLVVQMTPTAAIVDALRSSENVQIVEPNYRVILLSSPNASLSGNTSSEVYSPSSEFMSSTNENPITVMGTLFTTADNTKDGFFVQPGDTLTAIYAHPDGTELRTKTTIK